ncbi:MAG: sirohydrochlorin cobaltochelatase [Candidatus Methanoplasma sp.]|jgi:sirohydrochlorin cobaltochelatase|nr:sirohydrochlorin cobaltochelatase [Candidatus Methanoplasma sp.]
MGKRGIMIMGHGSTMAFNRAVMELHVGILRQKGFDNIYIGYNEASDPLISVALEGMVADGIDEILCLPFFIASGLHMTRDIPAKLGIPGNVSEVTSEVNGKKIKIHFEEPFGKDPLLTDILRRKIEELDEGIEKTGVMIMGHGSKLQYNREVMQFHADALRGMGHDACIGFNEMNRPTIDESLEAMLDNGIDHVIALPLFIALGKHLTMDVPPRLHLRPGADRGTHEHKGRQVIISYAHPIGSDRRLSDLLEAKIRKHYG